MSENIILGKSRKSGKWEILVDPSESYDAHLRAYQRIAKNIPVNDDYSKVLLGRVQNTSSPLTLITGEENKARIELQSATIQSATNAGKDAEDRQAKLTAQSAERHREIHETVIDEKNAMINKIRKATGQAALETTKAEQSEDALRERLSKVAPFKKPTPEELAEAEKTDAQKSKEQLLAEKNKITETTQQQAEALNEELAEAEKTDRKKKKE